MPHDTCSPITQSIPLKLIRRQPRAQRRGSPSEMTSNTGPQLAALVRNRNQMPEVNHPQQPHALVSTPPQTKGQHHVWNKKHRH